MAEPVVLALEHGDERVSIAWEDGFAAGDDAAIRWEAAPTPDAARWESLRVLTAAFEDGSALALAALRPRGAPGHGDDLVQALQILSGGVLQPLGEPLVSVQRDAAGALTRFNLEAMEGEEPAIVRAAGDAAGAAETLDHPAGTIIRTPLRMRMAGTVGSGILDVLELG